MKLKSNTNNHKSDLIKAWILTLLVSGIFVFFLNHALGQTVNLSTSIVDITSNVFADEMTVAGNDSDSDVVNTLTVGMMGNEYGAYSQIDAHENTVQNMYAHARNLTDIGINGNATQNFSMYWHHLSKVDAYSEAFTATADNNMSLDLGIQVAAGGTYNNGDAITVYYLYSVYAKCATVHENVSEDPISMVNYFELNGVDQLGGGFDFADPPGPPGSNSLVLVGGSFT
nr:hypothetical protein [Bacteroidota bacterium]